MLSLLRDLPWPIIIKVFAAGIACKALYIFYSDSPESNNSRTPPPDLKSNESNSPQIEPISNELINMKIHYLCQELIKIQPQLERIQTTLDYIKPMITQEFNPSNKDLNEPVIEHIIEKKSEHIKPEKEELVIKKQFETEELLIEKQSKEELVIEKQFEELVIEKQSKEELVIEKQSKEELVIENQSKEELVIENQSKEELVIEKQFETKELVIEKHSEKEELVIEKQSKEELVIEKQSKEELVIDTNESHSDDKYIETPKSANDKICSFILRSGLRKGQLCQSKVKGRNQIYCGIHR